MTTPQKRDCSEGCEDDGHVHAYEIAPSLQSEWDVMVADTFEGAARKVTEVAERLMDEMEPGETRTITIKFNGEQP